MASYDPFAPLNGSVLHKIDIGIAEFFTGVPGKSISAHCIAPAVRRGRDPHEALVRFHWKVIATLAALTLLAVGGAALAAARRPT